MDINKAYLDLIKAVFLLENIESKTLKESAQTGALKIDILRKVPQRKISMDDLIRTEVRYDITILDDKKFIGQYDLYDVKYVKDLYKELINSFDNAFEFTNSFIDWNSGDS